MACRFRITIDIDIDSATNVHPDNGNIIRSKQYSGGLYYYDTTNMENNTTKNQVTDYIFMNTVESNKSYFHRREIKGSDAARIFQQLEGWPSTQLLKEAVRKNQRINCLVTIDGINKEEPIYRPHIPIIQIKAIRRGPEYQNTTLRIPLPPPISKYHHNLEIVLNLFFVNGSSFLHKK